MAVAARQRYLKSHSKPDDRFGDTGYYATEQSPENTVRLIMVGSLVMMLLLFGQYFGNGGNGFGIVRQQLNLHTQMAQHRSFNSHRRHGYCMGAQ